MPEEPKPDKDGWYHFDDFEKFWKWVEGLPDYDPSHPPDKCQPVKIKRPTGSYRPDCKGPCKDGKDCFIQIENEDPGWKVRCHCR